jgi:hypothetical protein
MDNDKLKQNTSIALDLVKKRPLWRIGLQLHKHLEIR